jgi:hypothetical protein
VIARLSLALLCTLPIYGENQDDSVVPFRLFTSFAAEPSPSVSAALQDELNTIMSSAGWTIEWASYEESLGKISAKLAVARFRGRCGPEDYHLKSARRSILGSTVVTDGRILPYVDIFCDVVRAVMAYHLDFMKTDARRVAYGRALARVLAHELYHVLANDSAHGSEGVSKRNFSSYDLVAPSFRFDAKELEELRLKLLPALISSYPRLAHRQTELYLFIASGCSRCHDPAGEATPQAPGLRSVGQRADTAALESELTNPESKMCSQGKSRKTLWPKLSRDRVKALVTYLKDLAR